LPFLQESRAWKPLTSSREKGAFLFGSEEGLVPVSFASRRIAPLDEQDVSKPTVSNQKTTNKEDLQRQVKQLEQWALVARIGQKTMTLTDFGSGLNAERKNLQRVLARVQDYQVAEVVVTCSDRLTAFGFLIS
jgi:Resolvase, N terminal domain